MNIQAGADGTTLLGNFIGPNVTGTASVTAVGNGVRDEGDNVTIGNGTPAGRNLVAGNSGDGVNTNGHMTLKGNFLGTDPTGTVSVKNLRGVYASGGNVQIGSPTGISPGGPCTGDCNLISGNQWEAVNFEAGSVGSSVAGNFIGTDINGDAGLGNESGIRTRAPGLMVNDNVISGNGWGIFMSGGDMTVLSNIIGLNAAGNAAIPNTQEGIVVFDTTTASSIVIGGQPANQRNVISGNAGYGIRVSESSNVTIEGNYIGTMADGTSPGGNAYDGVYFQTGYPNTLTHNLIAYNTMNGVHASGAATTAHVN